MTDDRPSTNPFGDFEPPTTPGAYGGPTAIAALPDELLDSLRSPDNGRAKQALADALAEAKRGPAEALEDDPLVDELPTLLLRASQPEPEVIEVHVDAAPPGTLDEVERTIAQLPWSWKVAAAVLMIAAVAAFTAAVAGLFGS